MNRLLSKEKFNTLAKDLILITDEVLPDYIRHKGSYALFEQMYVKSAPFYEIYYNSVYMAALKTYTNIIIDNETKKKLERYKGKSDKLISEFDAEAKRRAKMLADETVNIIISEIPKGLDNFSVKDGIREALQNESEKIARYLAEKTGLLDNNVLLWEGEESGAEYYTIETDGNACATCSQYDGEELPINEAAARLNVPPFHPNCKCKVKVVDLRLTSENIISVGHAIYDFYQDLGYSNCSYDDGEKAIFYRDNKNGERVYIYHGFYKYDWYGEYVTPEFLGKVIDIAQSLDIEPDDLMMIMASESRIDPTAWNSASAVGLIQFTKISAEHIGTTLEDLRKMSAMEQLDYVEKYFSYRSDEIDNVVELYMVNAAAYIDLEDEIVYPANSDMYRLNSGLDKDNKGYVTKSDLKKHLQEMLDSYWDNKPKNHKSIKPIKKTRKG